MIKVLENQRNYLINKCFNECINCRQNVTISTQLTQFYTTLTHLKNNHNNQSIHTNDRQSHQKTTQHNITEDLNQINGNSCESDSDYDPIEGLINEDMNDWKAKRSQYFN